MKAYEIYIGDGRIQEVEVPDSFTFGEDETHVCATFLTERECLAWREKELEVHEGIKRGIVDEILSLVARLPARHGMCLHASAVAIQVLGRAGIHAEVRAGSLQWPKVRKEEDDGRMDTHFAYMWDPGSVESRRAVALGCLPEMHVWAVIPGTGSIMDFSTGGLRKAAESLGHSWTAEDPPDYVWCKPEDLPEWVVYTQSQEATTYALTALARLELAL